MSNIFIPNSTMLASCSGMRQCNIHFPREHKDMVIFLKNMDREEVPFLVSETGPLNTCKAVVKGTSMGVGMAMVVGTLNPIVGVAGLFLGIVGGAVTGGTIAHEHEGNHLMKKGPWKEQHPLLNSQACYARARRLYVKVNLINTKIANTEFTWQDHRMEYQLHAAVRHFKLAIIAIERNEARQALHRPLRVEVLTNIVMQYLGTGGTTVGKERNMY